MNFKPGQKVLCINDQFMRYCAYPIKKGVIYTIDGFYGCQCGSDQITLAERKAMIDMICKCNRRSYRRQSYFSWRFIPLELFDNFIYLSDKETTPEEIIIQNPVPRKEEIKSIPDAIPAENINFSKPVL